MTIPAGHYTVTGSLEFFDMKTWRKSPKADYYWVESDGKNLRTDGEFSVWHR